MPRCQFKDVLFIVYFCLDKFSISLDTFLWHTSEDLYSGDIFIIGTLLIKKQKTKKKRKR